MSQACKVSWPLDQWWHFGRVPDKIKLLKLWFWRSRSRALGATGSDWGCRVWRGRCKIPPLHCWERISSAMVLASEFWEAIDLLGVIWPPSFFRESCEFLVGQGVDLRLHAFKSLALRPQWVLRESVRLWLTDWNVAPLALWETLESPWWWLGRFEICFVRGNFDAPS